MQPKDFNSIFNTQEKGFLPLAKDIFKYQVNNVELYREFVKNINPNLLSDPDAIKNIADIPCLPISAFKNNKVIVKGLEPSTIFMSSGTTGNRSKHYVHNIELYKQSFSRSFEIFYKDISNYHVLALLPSYIEQGSSSLVYMVDNLIKKTKSKHSNFFLDNHDSLYETITSLVHYKNSRKILLIGVSYALLDFAEKYSFQNEIENLIIMETGGMKGRRKEISRLELHQILKKSFKCKSIHSEYGMTEMLSQAYSYSEGVFQAPPWLHVLISDMSDPFTVVKEGKTGIVKIIDLANIYSCSFIATEDVGISLGENKFQILGRLANTDLRGCNLMIET